MKAEWALILSKRNFNYRLLPARITASAFSHEGEIRRPPNSIQQTLESVALFIWLQHQLYRLLAVHMWWYRQRRSSCQPNTHLHSHLHGSNRDCLVHFLFCLKEKRDQRLTPCVLQPGFPYYNSLDFVMERGKRVFLLLEAQTQRLPFLPSCQDLHWLHSPLTTEQESQFSG